MQNKDSLHESKTNTFDDFMMYNLQSSNNQTHIMEERSQQAVNFYILMLTAIGGGVVIILTSNNDDSLNLIVLSLGLAVMAFYGFLTYSWLLAFLTSTTIEGLFRSVIYKYFQGIEPQKFSKYGLSDLLVWHEQAYERKSWLMPVSIATLVITALISSFMLAIACYLGWIILTNNNNLVVFIVVIILCILSMGILWKQATVKIGRYRASAEKYFFEDGKSE